MNAYVNNALESGGIVLPLPPSDASAVMEMEIYVRFMRHLRHVPSLSAEIRVLAAIQFTADILDHSDALVSKVLVDLGLRAPRRAFPAAWLEHVENSMRRLEWHTGAASAPVRALCIHWSGLRAAENGSAARESCTV